MRRNIFTVLVLALQVLILSSCGSNDGKNTDGNRDVSGAGTTFPLPFYLMAFDSYETDKGSTINYDDCGTKKGISKLQDLKVDFAASDEFLTDEQMANMKPVLHIPTCVVATAVAYNLPGISKLNLSGDVVADIYAGKITMWNDTRIKTINPGVQLPEKGIKTVYRTGKRSITFIFTSYLSAVSDEWKAEQGASMSINVPKGIPADNNAEVVAKLKDTPYSIGYMGSEYASVLKMPVAALKNANGEFVTPNAVSISASAATDIPADTRTLLVNSPAKGAYPITSFSWILIYKEQNYNNRTEEQARATVSLLKYMLSNETQQSADDIGYSPLPKSMAVKIQKNLQNVTYNGHRIL